MSIAAKMGIEEKLNGTCEECGHEHTLVKRWGRKRKDGVRKFICVTCAGMGTPPQAYMVMREIMEGRD